MMTSENRMHFQKNSFSFTLGYAGIDFRVENHGSSWSTFECGQFIGCCYKEYCQT